MRQRDVEVREQVTKRPWEAPACTNGHPAHPRATSTVRAESSRLSRSKHCAYVNMMRRELTSPISQLRVARSPHILLVSDRGVLRGGGSVEGSKLVSSESSHRVQRLYARTRTQTQARRSVSANRRHAPEVMGRTHDRSRSLAIASQTQLAIDIRGDNTAEGTKK